MKSIRVKGQRIPVRRRSLPRDTWGHTYLDDPEPEISVSRRLSSPRSILITILHEALHHLRPHDREQMILRLEKDLVHLMSQNKSLFRRLLDAL